VNSGNLISDLHFILCGMFVDFEYEYIEYVIADSRQRVVSSLVVGLED
jgi:hypothetical protein